MQSSLESRVKQLSLLPSTLVSRVTAPITISLIIVAFLVCLVLQIAFPHQPLPKVILASPNPDTGNSRFLITPYAMPGPMAFSALTKETQKAFTINGSIPVQHWLRSDKGVAAPVWSESKIQRMMKLADGRNPNVDDALCVYGPDCNRAFFDALWAHPVRGMNVLVVGSIDPWLESICLSFGANSTTTVDFTKPMVVHPRFRAMSVDELDSSGEVFDAIFTYSSLEHDGLGRYGDPINPDADLKRMEKLKGLLHPDGKLYLGVPNGPDLLLFNAHRVYGPMRFPMLTNGWRILGTYGEDLDKAFNGTFHSRPLCYPYTNRFAGLGCFSQPVHVLKAAP